MVKPSSSRLVPRRFQKKPVGDTPVDQSQLKSTNINVIVANTLAKGLPLPTREAQGLYADFRYVDFIDQQEKALTLRQSFDKLSPELKGFFQNDPARLLEWVQDPENEAQAIKWGLRQKPQEPRKEPSLTDLVTEAVRAANAAPTPPPAPQGGKGGE